MHKMSSDIFQKMIFLVKKYWPLGGPLGYLGTLNKGSKGPKGQIFQKKL